MLIDARNLPDNTDVTADICIVGAGAAGISIAREFAGQSTKICVLESGGFQYDADTQALYEGASTGIPYYNLKDLRLRYFGGTTNHWAGVCRPLDYHDFKYRAWVPHSGWPIDRDELEPFYKRAHDVCEIPISSYDLGGLDLDGRPPLQLQSAMFETFVSRHSPPTRFGITYRNELQVASNIEVYLHANVVDIKTPDSGKTVSRIEARTLDGKEFGVRAKYYVLATGGIENVRLLLNARGAHPKGIGNDHDHVGRYFMEHPAVLGALLVPLNDRLSMDLYTLGTVSGATAGLRPTPESQTSQEILNVSASFLPASLVSEVRFTSPGLVGAMMAVRNENSLLAAGRHVMQIASDLDDLLIASHRRIFRPKDLESGYYVTFHVEQAPDPESRITLDSEKDQLGMQRVKLHWKLGDLERRTLRRLTRSLAKSVGSSGLGRVAALFDMQSDDWPTGLRGSWHQMGTTRMSTSSTTGVVNPDCRLHDVDNLYIAGSSVFPTSGCAGPTLSIVALALRLSDHLKNQISRG